MTAATVSVHDDLNDHDALGLADLVRSRQISAAELLERTTAKIAKANETLNAVTTMLPERADRDLAADRDGPFKGVPFATKDIATFVAGAPLTNGSRVFEGLIAPFDSEIVGRYNAAGLILCAQTTSPEFGATPHTESVKFGKTRNPWNTERSSGGSSGGAAALVAAGALPMAQASDGGGSIRVPASACGLFGMKPSRGRTPHGPGAAEGWNGLSINHAVTVSVRDSAALLDATAGPGIGARFVAAAPATSWRAAVEREPGRLKIALQVDGPQGEAHSDCRKAVRDAATLCEGLGHVVEEAAPSFDEEAVLRAMTTIIAANTRSTLDFWAALRGAPIRPEQELEPAIARYFEMGAALSAADLANAERDMAMTAEAYNGFLSAYDVLLTPTMAHPPPEFGLLALDDYDRYLAAAVAYTPFSAIVNQAGAPAMSVPIYWSDDGLPIGVQFAGRNGAEETLFSLAGQLERARPWARRRPGA